MAMLKSTSKKTVNFTDISRLEVVVNKNLNDAQRQANIVAKLQVRHPAVSFNATMFNYNGRLILSLPSQQGSNGKNWYPVVTLNDDVKEYLMHMAQHGDETENSPWYMEFVGKEMITKITDEPKNGSLGIKDIILDDNLTYNQIRSGILCKARIVLDIGTITGYTIFKSKFGNALFGSAPIEGRPDENGQGPRAYRLSREATAQILAFVHSQVDWDKVPEIPEEAEKQANEKPGEFEPVSEEELNGIEAVMFGT